MGELFAGIKRYQEHEYSRKSPNRNEAVLSLNLIPPSDRQLTKHINGREIPKNNQFARQKTLNVRCFTVITYSAINSNLWRCITHLFSYQL